LLLDLLLGDRHRLKVGDRRRGNEYVGIATCRCTAAYMSRALSTLMRVTPGRESAAARVR
jgi:hypothetical protein